MGYVPFLRFEASQYGMQVVMSVAIVMLITGLMSLLYGWKLYRFVVIVATALAGAYLGWYLTYGYTWCPEKLRFLGPIVLGLAGGVLAIPLQKAAVFFTGASVGFCSLGPFAAGLVWKTPPGPTTTQALLASLGGFIVLGVLSVLVFKAMVMIATSLLGATLVLSGVAQIVQSVWVKDKDVFTTHQMELAGAYLVLAVCGVIFQSVAHGKKATAKKKKK